MSRPDENSNLPELDSEPQVKVLVDRFYDNVRKDDQLGPVFENVIRGRWQQHLETMYKFWNAVLLERPGYLGKPFRPHMALPITEQHFERWLQLFFDTIDSNFSGSKSEEAKWRAGRMADLFRNKLEYIRNNPGKTIL